MRYLFLVGHPAHVHFFRNVIQILQNGGHEILVGAVAREVTIQLLDAFKIPYFVYGATRRELLCKALDILPKDFSLLGRTRKFNPDMLVSTGSPYAAHVAAILSKPHLAFGDTENAALVLRLMLPFTDVVFTPSCFERDLGPKHVRYLGYKELAYLHPKRFSPDPGVLDLVGLGPKDRFAVLRFSSWDSSHVRGLQGRVFRSNDSIASFVEELEREISVFVTSEKPLPAGLLKRAPRLPPTMVHHLLAFATLYVGEGATMASEAGVLGTPWVFASTVRLGTHDDQQLRYGLGYREGTIGAVSIRTKRLLRESNLKPRWQARRELMLSEKVDVTDFITNALETRFPERLRGIQNMRWPDEPRPVKTRDG